VIRALRALRCALAYYTILPAGSLAAAQAPDVSALEWLPVVGALVGALAGLVGFAAGVWLRVPWAFVAAWAACLVLTGALHADGLLDACDGLLVTASPQRRLEILKDVRHGTFAVVGMLVVSALWLAALAAIAPSRYPLVLAFSGAAARLAVVPLATLFPYAPSGSMLKTFDARPSTVALAFNFVVVEVLAFVIAPWALVLPPAAMLAAWAGATWAARRLGGVLTGDVYGALIVMLEVALLLAVGVVASR
jgi:adenosylcobinamide-GDP ribazoletransferase